MRKLPQRFTPVLMPLCISFIMTGIVSAISLTRTFGLTADALHHWPAAWLASWVIAFPVLIIVLPMVRRFVSSITE